MCLALAPALWFLINDAWVDRFFGKTSGNTTVGVVTSKSGDVRKRAELDMIWSQVKEGDPLQENDVMFTGPESKTRVDLLGGTIIDVGSDSVVLIDLSSPDIPGVRIDKGEVRFSARNESAKAQVRGQGSRPVLLTPKPESSVLVDTELLREPRLIARVAAPVPPRADATDGLPTGVKPTPAPGDAVDGKLTPSPQTQAQAARQREEDTSVLDNPRIRTFLLVYIGTVAAVLTAALIANRLS